MFFVGGLFFEPNGGIPACASSPGRGGAFNLWSSRRAAYFSSNVQTAIGAQDTLSGLNKKQPTRTCVNYLYTLVVSDSCFFFLSQNFLVSLTEIIFQSVYIVLIQLLWLYSGPILDTFMHQLALEWSLRIPTTFWKFFFELWVKLFFVFILERKHWKSISIFAKNKSFTQFNTWNSILLMTNIQSLHKCFRKFLIHEVYVRNVFSFIYTKPNKKFVVIMK